MNKFQRSWQLFKSSVVVLQQNRALLVFPAVITAFMVFIAILFLTPVAFQGTGYSYTSSQHWKAVANSIYVPDPAQAGNHHLSRHNEGSLRPIAMVYFAGMYFVSMFCATFFNVAFYSEIMKALKGQPVSIQAGLQFACSKWKSILLWTMFAGLIGYVIKALEQRFGLFGRIILRLIGMAWSVACVFVIPVIVTENETSNPFSILKKSALTLKQTWGESLIGYAGVSVGGTIVLLTSLVWLGASLAISIVLKSYWIIAIAGAGWLIGIVAFSYLMGVASQIFRCALYLYASEGTIPHPFSSEMIELAWRRKKA